MPLAEVRRGLGAGFGNNSSPPMGMSTLGHLIVVNFYQAMILDGRGYQVRAGTVTTPSTGDVAITDTDAEMCADAASGTTIMPMTVSLTLDAKGGDAFESAAKSVAVVSNSGAAFVPLPLKSDASAAVSTARVEAAGVVQVPAELSTDTLRHFEWSQEFVQDAGTEAPGENVFVWAPIAAPVLVGARCFYVQIASATTGPVYFAHFDYLEMPTLMVSPS